MYTQLHNHFHDTAQFANWAVSWFRESGNYEEMSYNRGVGDLEGPGDQLLEVLVRCLHRRLHRQKGFETKIIILPIDVKSKS